MAEQDVGLSGDAIKFRTWIKQMEKYIVLAGLGRYEAKMVAYQARDPPVSDFIHKWLVKKWRGRNCWMERVKNSISWFFLEVSDSQHAIDLLSIIKEIPGENVPIFAERLYNLAEELFEGQNVYLPIIQNCCVAMTEQNLKRKGLNWEGEHLSRSSYIHFEGQCVGL